jgi:hypothetical protein
VFRSNPGFVFHDSIGFEAGGVDEFKKMKEFISERASTRILDQRIHAIWQAIISMRLYLMVILSLAGIASQWMNITERSRRVRKSFSLSATPTMVHCDYNVLDGLTDNGICFSTRDCSVHEK